MYKNYMAITIHRYDMISKKAQQDGTVDVYEFLYLLHSSRRYCPQLGVRLCSAERSEVSIQYSDTWRAGSVKTFCSSDYEALEDSACLRGKTNINTCIGAWACTSTPSLLLSIHMTVDTLSRMVFSWRAGVQPQQNFLRYPSASKYIFLVRESAKVGASILYEGIVPK